jgi:cholesterol oxidase
VIVGSGYGGAITAARLSNVPPPHKPSVCVLERGQEWKKGEFPNTAGAYAQNLRDVNPLGLYELINYNDITVIKGSGLGGTSLVNANVAIRPSPKCSTWRHGPRRSRSPNLLSTTRRPSSS